MIPAIYFMFLDEDQVGVSDLVARCESALEALAVVEVQKNDALDVARGQSVREVLDAAANQVVLVNLATSQVARALALARRLP